jgi:hypothetical protein
VTGARATRDYSAQLVELIEAEERLEEERSVSDRLNEAASDWWGREATLTKADDEDA